jgi:hypothetical protein
LVLSWCRATIGLLVSHLKLLEGVHLEKKKWYKNGTKKSFFLNWNTMGVQGAQQG